MNNTNTSHQIAATCLVITFILASIAVAEDDATADNDKQETLELITLDNPADVEVDNSESDDEEAGPPLPGQESDLEELHRTFALYKSAVANNSYDEADTLAKRMVELAIGADEPRPRSTEKQGLRVRRSQLHRRHRNNRTD